MIDLRIVIEKQLQSMGIQQADPVLLQGLVEETTLEIEKRVARLVTPRRVNRVLKAMYGQQRSKPAQSAEQASLPLECFDPEAAA